VHYHRQSLHAPIRKTTSNVLHAFQSNPGKQASKAAVCETPATIRNDGNKKRNETRLAPSKK